MGKTIPLGYIRKNQLLSTRRSKQNSWRTLKYHVNWK